MESDVLQLVLELPTVRSETHFPESALSPFKGCNLWPYAIKVPLVSAYFNLFRELQARADSIITHTSFIEIDHKAAPASHKAASVTSQGVSRQARVLKLKFQFDATYGQETSCAKRVRGRVLVDDEFNNRMRLIVQCPRLVLHFEEKKGPLPGGPPRTSLSVVGG